MVELVAWVRAHVPAEVALEVFDSDLTFDPQPLPPCITSEQLIADYWPDVPELDARSRRRPRTAEEWSRPLEPPDQK
jgi:hypothetical protein